MVALLGLRVTVHRYPPQVAPEDWGGSLVSSNVRQLEGRDFGDVVSGLSELWLLKCLRNGICPRISLVSVRIQAGKVTPVSSVTATVQECVRAPSEELLGGCSREQLVKIAEHFKLDVGHKRLKESMRHYYKGKSGGSGCSPV